MSLGKTLCDEFVFGRFLTRNKFITIIPCDSGKMLKLGISVVVFSRQMFVRSFLKVDLITVVQPI